MRTCVDHLPEKKQQELQTIVTLIRDRFDAYIENKDPDHADKRIVKIILFGSYAKGNWVNDPENGYMSDYDILLILNGERWVEEYALWSDVEQQIQRRITAPLSLIIHSVEDVSNRLKQGHYFFSDIRLQGIELYSGMKKALRQPGNLSASEQKAIAEKHFKQWFESAGSFLIDFGHCMDRKDLKKAAFELHQAAERYFDCTLLVYSNYLPKTHNLEQLRAFCAEHDPRYIHILPGNNKFNRRSAQRLKRAYVEARYSEHYEITEEELNWLVEQVQQLKTLTEESCQARIAQLSIVSV